MYNAVSYVFPVPCVIIIVSMTMRVIRRVCLGEWGMWGWEEKKLKLREECKIKNWSRETKNRKFRNEGCEIGKRMRWSETKEYGLRSEECEVEGKKNVKLKNRRMRSWENEESEVDILSLIVRPIQSIQPRVFKVITPSPSWGHHHAPSWGYHPQSFLG